jgi:hypothetical protein
MYCLCCPIYCLLSYVLFILSNVLFVVCIVYCCPMYCLLSYVLFMLSNVLFVVICIVYVVQCIVCCPIYCSLLSFVLFVVVLYIVYVVLRIVCVVLWIVCCCPTYCLLLSYVLFVCKCVLCYCHRVSIQRQLTNLSILTFNTCLTSFLTAQENSVHWGGEVCVCARACELVCVMWNNFWQGSIAEKMLYLKIPLYVRNWGRFMIDSESVSSVLEHA